MGFILPVKVTITSYTILNVSRPLWRKWPWLFVTKICLICRARGVSVWREVNGVCWMLQTKKVCNCKASSSSLIGGSGAGWEGTAVLHHGSYIKVRTTHASVSFRFLRLVYIRANATSLPLGSWRIQLYVYIEHRQRSKNKFAFTF